MADSSKNVVFKFEGDSRSLIKSLDNIGAELKNITAAMNRVNQAGNKAPVSPINKLSAAWDKASQAAKKYLGSAKSTNAAVKTNTTAKPVAQGDVKSLKNYGTEAGKVFTKVKNGSKDARQQVSNASKSIESLTKKISAFLRAVSKLFTEVKNKLKDLTTKIKAVNKEGAKISPDAQNKLAKAWGNATAAVSKYVSTAKKASSVPVRASTSSASAAPAPAPKTPGSTGYFTGAASSFMAIRGILPGIQSGITGVAGTFSKFFGNMYSLTGAIQQSFMVVADSLRLMTQGIMNFGRNMMFFVSLPVLALMKGAYNVAVEFEDAMVRVQKTTNLTNEETKKLGTFLRELTRNSKSSHVELAKIAEVLGQLGLTGVGAIGNMTYIVELFATATGLAAEDAALSLGKIANAFGINMQESTADVMRLANTINYLENTTAASAGEIVDVTLKWAQAAATLNVPIATATAFSATMISMGLSTEEAGTSLKNMAGYLGKNADKIAGLMRNYEQYNTEKKITAALDKDAVQVMLDLAKAASLHGSETEALVALQETLNQRGGRAAQAMAKHYDKFIIAIQRANQEFKYGSSMLIEYERAMQSTKSQVALLKNNFSDMWITLGETVLPVINTLVQFLVPAIREVTAAFSALSKQQKLLIVGGILLTVVLGPLIMFFGAILHSVTLVALAIGKLASIIPVTFNLLRAAVPVIAGFGKAMFGVPGLIAGGVVLLLKLLATIGVNIAGFFTNLAQKSLEWGENLSKNIANGFWAGAVRWISKVMAKIASMIAGFFESHSPPKKGPLATIDKWGAALLKTFLGGFRNADFSILSEIGGIIKEELTSGLDDKKMPAALAKVAQKRIQLAKVIDKYNSQGIIDQDLLNASTQGLGIITEHVRNLVKYSLEYNDIQEQIKRIEDQRRASAQKYSREIINIGRSSMSVEQKVAAIRASQRGRDDRTRGLDEQEDRLKIQSEMMQANVELQRNMIDALTEQKDILQQIADLLNRLSEAKGKDEGMAFGGGADFSDLDELVEQAEAAQQELMKVKDRFTEGKMLWDAFKAGLSGDTLSIPPETVMSALPQSLQDVYAKMPDFYDMGKKAGEARDKILEFSGSVVDAVDGIKNLFSFDLSLELSGVSSDMGSWWDDLINSPGAKSFRDLFDTMRQSFSDMGVWLSDIWEYLKRQFETFAQIWKPLGDTLDKYIIKGKSFGEVMGVIGKAILWFITAVGAGITMFAGWVGVSIAAVVGVLQGLVNVVSGLVMFLGGLLVGLVKLLVEGFTKGWSEAWESFKTLIITLGSNLVIAFKELFGIKSPSTVFMAIGKNIIQGLIDGITGMITAVITGITTIATNILTKFSELFGIASGVSSVFLTFGENLIQGLIDGLVSMKDKAVEAIKTLAENILNKIKEILGIASPSTVFSGFGVDLIQGFIDGFGSMVDTALTKVGEFGGKILGAIGKAFGFGGGDKESEKEGSSGFLPNFDDVITNVGKIKEAIEDIKGKIADAWRSLWSGDMVGAATQALGIVQQAISGLVTAFSIPQQVILAAWKSFWGLVRNYQGVVIDLIKNKVRDMFVYMGAQIDSSVEGPLGELQRAWAAIAQQIISAKSALQAFILLSGGTLPSKDGKKGDTTRTQMAKGGSIWAGRSYLTGEEGVEAIVARRNGFVIPSDVLGSYFDDTANNSNSVVIQINNPVVRDEMDIRRIAKAVEEVMSKKTYNATKFGGAPAF